MRTCWVACLVVGCTFSPTAPAPEDAGHPDAVVIPTDARVLDGRPDAVDEPDATLPLCPASYFQIAGGGTYRTSVGLAEWAEAQAACLADEVSITGHTHLLVIDDEPERSATNALVSGINVWIGLTDRITEGTFVWVTAEPTAGYPPGSGSPWSAGEPNGGVAEDCAYMRGDADFGDSLCDIAVRYICECDAFPADPSRY